VVFVGQGSRRMRVGGVTASPAGKWTVQQARNLVLSFGDRFEDVKFLIRDWDRTSPPRSAPSSRLLASPVCDRSWSIPVADHRHRHRLRQVGPIMLTADLPARSGLWQQACHDDVPVSEAGIDARARVH
jgi:hypothetical protein